MKNKKITYSSLNFKRDYELKLKHISIMNFDKEISNRINGSHCSEIYYILNGNCQAIFYDEVRELNSGDILLISNRSAEVILNPIGCSIQFLVVGFDGISISPDSETCEGSTSYVLSSIDPEGKAHCYLNELITEAKNRSDDSQFITTHLTNLIIAYLEREGIAKFYPTTSERNFKECELLKEFIDEKFREDISLDELAAMVFMDKYHLVHEFKKCFGTTPISYLVDQRIEQCKILLENSDFNMEEIAKDVGFNSQSYFNQIFKKKVGMTPSQYKRDYR